MKLQGVLMGKWMKCDPVMAGSLNPKSEIEISHTPGLEIEKKLQKRNKTITVTDFFPSKPSVLVSGNPAQMTKNAG
jgi:hypothetical protein